MTKLTKFILQPSTFNLSSLSVIFSYFWFWCYYLHWSRDLVSPVCRIFVVLNLLFILIFPILALEKEKYGLAKRFTFLIMNLCQIDFLIFLRNFVAAWTNGSLKYFFFWINILTINWNLNLLVFYFTLLPFCVCLLPTDPREAPAGRKIFLRRSWSPARRLPWKSAVKSRWGCKNNPSNTFLKWLKADNHISEIRKL